MRVDKRQVGRLIKTHKDLMLLVKKKVWVIIEGTNGKYDTKTAGSVIYMSYTTLYNALHEGRLYEYKKLKK